MENLSVLPIGTIIQGTKYRIDEVLGQGSFGITYKVTDTILERVYALKEFFPQEIAERNTSVSLTLRSYSNKREQFKALRDKFFSEAKNLAHCNHPGIVKIHSVLTPDDNTVYYCMDYIEGTTLNKKYKNNPMNLQDAIAMILKIAEPLEYIHNLSDPIAHLDLNPNNVMLCPDGSVVLIDFGFAKGYDSTGMQKTKGVLAGGTPGYIAPEQMSGVIMEFTRSVDVYALGGIFYFLLTGANPPVCMDLLQDWDILLSKLPEETHTFFEKAMSMRKKDRFASIEEFCKELLVMDSDPDYKAFCRKGKWNYIDKNGKYLSAQWFDDAWSFSECFGLVKLNDKWNYIDKNGKYFSEKWFDDAWSFSECFGLVKLNYKWNYIDKNGRYFSEKWFDEAESFSEGLGAVKLNGKWNYIDKNGKYLSAQWFDVAWSFSEGLGAVKLNGKYNYIDKNGKYLSAQWFDDAWSFSEGYANVELNGEWNYIDKDGKYLSEQWFDKADYFDECYAKVQLDSKWNYIGKDGKYLSVQWFDYACDFWEGFGAIELNGKWNYIDKNGKYLSAQWFDYVCDFWEGFGAIELNGKWNYIDKNGKYLSAQWFDEARRFSEGSGTVNLHGKYNYIDKDGRYLSEKWFDRVGLNVSDMLELM